MIFLEKSELPFSKCPIKNYITPSPEKMSIPLKKKPQSAPHSPNHPHLYPNNHAPDVFLSFHFLYLKLTDNTQLCTGKIGIIPSNNTENRP